jgi:hypothetical protein
VLPTPQLHAALPHSLARIVARIVLTHRTGLIVIPVIQQHMAVRAKILVLGDAGSANIQKTHDVFLSPALYRAARLFACRCGYFGVSSG